MWEPAEKPIRTAARALIVRDGQVLVTINVDAVGEWYMLPGGGQRHGEDLASAVRRECREEIGCDVRVGRLRFVRDYIGKNHEFADEDADQHQVEFIFECELMPGQEPNPRAAADSQQTGVKWLPLTALASHRFYPRALIPYLVSSDAADAVVYLGDVN